MDVAMQENIHQESGSGCGSNPPNQYQMDKAK